MKVTAVESTTLATVVYDEAREMLRLEFRSRAIYEYFGVSASVHEALLCAPSKGSCFNLGVRGFFPYKRVSNWQVEAPDAETPAGDRQ
jgi:hypothetical protein